MPAIASSSAGAGSHLAAAALCAPRLARAACCSTSKGPPCLHPHSSAATSSRSSVLAHGLRARKAASTVQSSQPAPPPPLPNAVSYAVIGSACFAATAFASMILLPRALAVRRFMQSYWAFAPLALAYAALLAYSYTPDTLSLLLPGSLEAGLTGFKPQFFPQLEGIQQLFQQPATTASWVVHMLSINLFLGRGIYLDGANKAVPTRHSLLATMFLGPVGLLLHWATSALFGALPGLKKPAPIVQRGPSGCITLLPYE